MTKATKSAAAPAASPVVVAAAALYEVSAPFQVRGSSSRGYAQAQLQALAQAHPKGFTLAQYRAALVANLAKAEGHLPKGGWAKHNMPTWSLGQGWIAPVGAAKKATGERRQA